MKKTLLATLVAGFIPMIAAAQGTVNFGTTAAAHKIVQEDQVTPVGAGYSAALYWAPLGTTDENLFTQLGAITGVSGGTGFLVAGGTRTTGLGTPAGSDALFQIRAWSGAFASYEAAAAGGALVGRGGGGTLGSTAWFQNTTGNPAGSPPTNPALLTGWTQPVVIPVPEPSTFALAGLGAAALLLFRRRK